MPECREPQEHWPMDGEHADHNADHDAFSLIAIITSLPTRIFNPLGPGIRVHHAQLTLTLYIGWSNVTVICDHSTISMVYCAKLITGEDLWRDLNYQNSSEDEIANVNFLRRRRTCRGQRLRTLNWVPNFYYN